jgi:hypothetical protein
MKQPDAPERRRSPRPRPPVAPEVENGSKPKAEHDDAFPSMWDGILFDLIDDC